MLRKLMPSLLLGIFLFQLLGFGIYFEYEKAKIKKQLKTFLKQGVPENQLKIFNLSRKEYQELTWTKAKKEFKIGTRFYDVVWQNHTKSGKVLLKCVDDKQESTLFEKLGGYLNSNLGDKKSNHPLQTIFSSLQQPFVFQDPFSWINSDVLEVHSSPFFAYVEMQSSVSLKIPSPPPNV